MPLSFKDFVTVLRGLPKDATPEQIRTAADAAEKGTPLEHIWATVNRPLGGSADALIPQLRHEHGKDESALRRGAEDFGATLTSPASLATMALGAGAAKAGEAGLLGISRAARAGEAALQVPYAVEGLRNATEGDTPGQRVAGAVQTLAAGAGVRHAATHAFDPEAVGRAYAAERGLPYGKVEPRADASRSMAIADAYEAMPHTPNDPKVQASYAALRNAIEDQWDFLTKRAGVKAEPWTQPGQPYKNSAEMVADVKGNNHLFYFPSEQGFGQGEEGAQHPMLAMTKYGVPVNDLFRAVHDYFGHAQHGFQFGPLGEEGAWLEHRQMLPDAARPALTTETRGQNSWVNFGPHMRNAAGELLKKGDEGFLPATARPYAEQKAGLLPEQFTRPEPEILGQGEDLVRPTLREARRPEPATADLNARLGMPRWNVRSEAELDNIRSNSHYGDGHVIQNAMLPSELRSEQPLSIEELLGTGQHFGILSAGNPNGTVINAEENAARHALLMKELKAMGFSPIEQNGVYGGAPEPSVLVPGLPAALTKMLGKRFSQEAVISHEGWHRLGDDATFPRTGLGFDQQAENYYSELRHPGYPPLKYQMAFPDEAYEKASPNTIESHTGAGPAGPEGGQKATLSPVYGSTNPMRAALVRGPVASLEDLQRIGVPGAGDEAAKLRAANPDLFPAAARTASAVVGPAAASQIDDSDPNDPNYQLKHFGKLALEIGSLYGLGSTALGAAKRVNELPLAKQAAGRGAALLMLNTPRREWASKIAEMGVPKEQLATVRAASEKMLQQQIEKAGGKLPKTKQLLSYLAAGKGDADWYNTQQELEHYFGKDAPVMARLIAATSNNSTVPSNLTLALKAYAQHKLNPDAPIEGIMRSLLPAVNKALSGEELGGRKVEAFSRALLGDPNAVVVDRWMMRAFGFKGDIPTPKQYDIIEHAVRELAAREGIEPRQVQAAMWFGKKAEDEAGKNRPASPPYGAILKQKLNGTAPDALPDVLKTAAQGWKLSPKKGFSSALQKAILQRESALPLE